MAILILSVVAVVGIGNAVINRYAKPRLEQAFRETYPGAELRIGGLDYNLWRNRLSCHEVVATGSNRAWNCHIQSGSVLAMPWWAMFFRTPSAKETLHKSDWQLNDFLFQFTNSTYGLTGREVRLSMTKGELVADEVEVRPSSPDEQFFSLQEYRRVRLHWVFPKATLHGLDTGALLDGNGLRARSIVLERPVLDTLSSRDKPVNPHRRQRVALPAALSALPYPIAVERLTVTNGFIRAGQRLAAGTEPGYLTFGSIEMTIDGLSNLGQTNLWVVRGQTQFMEQAPLKLVLEVGVQPRELSLRYSGSLGQLDLTRLNSFLAISAGTRLESGMAYEAAFEAEGRAGRVRGVFRGAYEGLDLVFLDRASQSKNGVLNRIKSALADSLVVRNSNMPTQNGPMAVGRIDYTAKPDENFFHFLWFGVRSGLLDLLGLSDFVKESR